MCKTISQERINSDTTSDCRYPSWIKFLIVLTLGGLRYLSFDQGIDHLSPLEHLVTPTRVGLGHETVTTRGLPHKLRLSIPLPQVGCIRVLIPQFITGLRASICNHSVLCQCLLSYLESLVYGLGLFERVEIGELLIYEHRQDITRLENLTPILRDQAIHLGLGNVRTNEMPHKLERIETVHSV